MNKLYCKFSFIFYKIFFGFIFIHMIYNFCFKTIYFYMYNFNGIKFFIHEYIIYNNIIIRRPHIFFYNLKYIFVNNILYVNIIVILIIFIYMYNV